MCSKTISPKLIFFVNYLAIDCKNIYYGKSQLPLSFFQKIELKKFS